MKAEFTKEHLAKADDWATKAAQEEIDKAHEIAKHIAEADVLSEHAKDVLAQIKTRIEEEHGDKISEASLDRLARSTEEWKEFRVGQFEAIRRATQARFDEKNGRIRIRNAERHWETTQSGLSYRKKEIERSID